MIKVPPYDQLMNPTLQALKVTGNFTKDAVKEATRDGAPAIDLIDGDQLINKLKDLSLGVQTKKIEIEHVVVDQRWFSTI